MENYMNLMVTSEPTRRWDDLPEFIIQHIQSHLPTMTDGINSSLVSKTYLRAWSNRPFLRFHGDLKPPALHPFFSRSSPGPIRADCIKAIDDTLARYQKHNLTLEKFHLAFATNGDPISEAPLMNRWFQVVCRLSGLKEISLHISDPTSNYSPYRHHIDEIFLPKTLETVILRGLITLEEHKIKCSRLRYLELHDVEAGQELLDTLFTACPLIENIILFWCRTYNNGVVIKVKNLLHLRSFTFDTSFDDIVEIDNTPNLRSFSYRRPNERSPLTLKFDANPALTCLNITGQNIYPFEEYLRTGYFTLSGNTIHVTSDSLKELNISMPNNVHPTHVHIYAPNLIAFGYNTHPLFSSASPLISFDDDIFSGPCEMRLTTYMPKRLDTSYFQRMREIFQRSSSGSRVILYTHEDHEVNINVHELMMVSHPPMVELKLLQLGIESPILSTVYDAKIIDALFSICHPRIVQVFYGVKLKECLRKVLMESESPRCCAGHGQNPCWRHYLKGFKIGFGYPRVDDDDDGNITWLPRREWTKNKFAKHVIYNIFFGLDWLDGICMPI